MKYDGFIGSSYQSQSVISDAELTMNWYQERIESESGANRSALYPCPGFQRFVQAGQIMETGVRAMAAAGSQVFAVVDGWLYELFADGTATKRNPALKMAVDAHLATINYNGKSGGQLFVTSGTNAYTLVLASNTFAAVGSLAGKATMGAMKNGICLAFDQTTGIVYFSAVNDATSFATGTDFFARSLRPDPWQAMAIGPDFNLWMIGTETSEIWGYFGTLTNPFQPLVGAVIPYGTVAPWSVTVDNQIKWLSQTSAGALIFVSASGYDPQRISTHSTAWLWSGYSRTTTVTDAESFPYQDQDHPFSVLNFPTADATFVTDNATNTWHQRGYWDSANTKYRVYRPRVHCYAFGRHLIGERSTGMIATMDVTYTSESDESVIRRVRQAPGILDELRAVKYPRLSVLMETGLGLASGQGSNPLIAMQYSDDGGHTWSDERLCSAGAMGAYSTVVYWDRNGVGRHRVFRVICTDPIPWRLTDAYLGALRPARQAA